MTERKSETTAEAVIASAVEIVCSDGGSDPLRVASDVLQALEAAGFNIERRPGFKDWGRIG